ncbi:MAG: DegV family protein, partial [Bacillota bacterium]|nr:DegV family protein [Bacillota bacterium]
CFVPADFLARMKESKDYARSSCPSPGDYIAAYRGEEDRVYVITLSSKLSGSYNSAVQAKSIYGEEEKCQGKKIHVFDSKGAGGMLLQATLKIMELEEAGKTFDEIVTETTRYINESHILFLLDNYDNFRKNGRLNNIQAALLDTLHIKLIMQDNGEGEIAKAGQDLSFKRALNHMCKLVVKNVKNPAERILVVTHCANDKLGKWALSEILKHCKFKASYLLEGRGITTMYANEGGILISY